MAATESQASFWRRQRKVQSAEMELASTEDKKFPLTWRILRLHTMAEEPNEMADELVLILVELKRTSIWIFILAGVITFLTFLSVIFEGGEIIDLWVVIPGSSTTLWFIKFVVIFGSCYALILGLLRWLLRERKREMMAALEMSCRDKSVVMALGRLTDGERAFFSREISHFFPFSVKRESRAPEKK